MVFLEKLYNPLLLAHLLITFVLIGAMAHNLLCVVDYVRGKFNRQKLELIMNSANGACLGHWGHSPRGWSV